MIDTMKTVPILLLLCLSSLSFCTTKPREPQGPGSPRQNIPIAETTPEPEAPPPLIETIIEKELLYDQHTLTDTYPYKDTTREFQWDKICSIRSGKNRPVGRSFKTTGTRMGKLHWSEIFIAMLTSVFPTL